MTFANDDIEEATDDIDREFKDEIDITRGFDIQRDGDDDLKGDSDKEPVDDFYYNNEEDN